MFEEKSFIESNNPYYMFKKEGEFMGKYGIVFTSIFSLLGSFTTFLFGGWDSLVVILLTFVIIDYVTGVIASAVEGKLSSKVGFKGIAQKIIIFALVAVSSLLDQVLGNQYFIRDATIFFYLVNEALSIIENAGRVGLPVPAFLVRIIEMLRNRSEK